MADSDLKGRRLGEFILREELDRGAYGVVYRAEQPALGRDVVVKVLQRDVRDLEATRRFLREAQVASVLDHPYAAHVYAFGVDDVTEKPWIAMELVKGVTLARWSRANGPMRLERLVPFFGCVAEVVQAAHEQGIVHRDLKPSNIMVIERGERLIPKLLDFGVAKWPQDGAGKRHAEIEAARAVCAADGGDPITARVRTQSNPQRRAAGLRHLTRDGVGLGSLPYMSPEQFRDSGTASAASDIYALGIIVYELLAGGRPFVADTAEGYQRKHLESPPPRLECVSPAVDEIVQHALAKDPDARPRSALDMARQLQDALQAEPREQLHKLATVWNARQQPRSLLLRDDALRRMEAETQTQPVGELVRSFLTQSRSDTFRRAKQRRALAIGAAAATLGLLVTVVWTDLARKAELAARDARYARTIADVAVAQATLEQGRSALLHGEPEAAGRLVNAYQRDHAPTTAFMLARALQPRLAEQARLPSSSGRMWSATFSPDGKQLVTSDDQSAQIWNAESYRPLYRLPHGDTVFHAAYSSDGTRVVTAGGDGAVKLWNASDGALVRELGCEGRSLRYYAVAMTVDARLVAAIDMEGALACAWDANTGALLAVLRNDASRLPSIAFGDHGRWLATSGGDDVRVFDTRTWAQVLSIRGPGIVALSWDPDGQHLLTGSSEGDVSLWDIPSGTRSRHLRDVGEPVDAVAYSPDGRLVVAASRDGAEQIWDTVSGKLRSQGNYLHAKILAIEFDPASRLTVAAGASGAISIVDVMAGMPLSVLDGPRNPVLSAHFDPGSHRVVGASWDGTARVWDAAALYRRWGSPVVAGSCGIIPSPEPDRQLLAIGCGGRPTRIWDTARGQLVATLPDVTPTQGAFASASPAVSGTGDRAAIARGNTVEIYELPSGRLLNTVTHGAAVSAVAFTSTGRDVLSGAVDGSLLVTRDGGALLAPPKLSGGIDTVGFLPDGRLVAADAKRRLRIYDPTGTMVAEFEAAERVLALRMSADGRRMLTLPVATAKIAPAELWDVEHYRAVAPLDEPGQGRVFSARFVAGDAIFTACGDGIARKWDGATGKLRRTYLGGTRFLADVTLSADGAIVVAGDADGLLRFWDAASGQPLWTMRAHRSHLVGIRIDGDDIVTRGFSGDVTRWTLPQPERVIGACGNHELCAAVIK